MYRLLASAMQLLSTVRLVTCYTKLFWHNFFESHWWLTAFIFLYRTEPVFQAYPKTTESYKDCWSAAFLLPDLLLILWLLKLVTWLANLDAVFVILGQKQLTTSRTLSRCHRWKMSETQRLKDRNEQDICADWRLFASNSLLFLNKRPNCKLFITNWPCCSLCILCET